MIIKITKITSLFLSIFAICILNISCISLVRGSEEEAVGKYNILNDYEIEILYRAPTIKFEFIIDFEHYENFSVFADGKQIITDTTEIGNNVKKLIVKTEHKLQIEKVTFDSSDNKFYFYSEIPAKDLSDFGILKTCGVNEFDYKKFLLGDVTSSIVGFDMFENSFTGSILAYGIIDNNIEGFYAPIIKFETAPRKNMNRLMSRYECYHVKHRSIIESDWGTLKNNFQLEYHKARSIAGMFRHFFTILLHT